MGRRMLWVGGVLVVAAVVVLCCRSLLSPPDAGSDDRAARLKKPDGPPPSGHQVATFGGGCFWCTEAVFQQLHGVHSAVPGYSGGNVPNPTYEQVCAGGTGHVEVVHITYDPNVIGYTDLLEVFWRTHDPTTRDRQGNDVGPQYRSVIFYHNEEQRQLAEQYKRQLDASGTFGAPIVTEIAPCRGFYPAENYHQDYFARNGGRSYCAVVIRPKLEKFEKAFQDRLKSPSR